MQLREFYRDVNRAIKADIKPEWFCINAGLCDNLINWYKAKAGLKYRYRELNRLKVRMSNQFSNAELNRLLPFNQSSMRKYIDECRGSMIYQNPQRLKWIRDHV